jgi:hypothetical protein
VWPPLCCFLSLLLAPKCFNARDSADKQSSAPGDSSDTACLPADHGWYVLHDAVCLRCIVQMSDALDLSSWATCRLVSGVPSLLNVNYDTLRNRWVLL